MIIPRHHAGKAGDPYSQGSHPKKSRKPEPRGEEGEAGSAWRLRDGASLSSLSEPSVFLFFLRSATAASTLLGLGLGLGLGVYRFRVRARVRVRVRARVRVRVRVGVRAIAMSMLKG